MITTELGRFADELSPSEAIMWKGDDQSRLRSGGPLLLLLDHPPEWPRVIDTFERFSRLFPRFRQRIVMTPLGLRRPQWVVDPDFDLSFHLRRVALPPPGSFEQLLGLIEHDACSSFDRLWPPWIGTLVENLDDGRAALVLKNHHALFDGRGMIQVFERCFDEVAEPGPRPEVARPPAQRVSEIELLRSALEPRRVLDSLRHSSQTVGAVVRASLNPQRTATDTLRVVQSVRQLMNPTGRDGSPLLRPRSSSVRLGTIEVPLSDLKSAARAAGGSLNDALLAAVADALGRYHSRMGQPVDSVNVGFPISLRSDTDDVGGNHFAGATIAAPAAALDTKRRIDQTRAAVLDARASTGIDVVGPLTTVMYGLPSWLIAALPIMDMIDAQVSNFPGLSRRRFVGGAEIVRTFGFGPHPGTPMMIVLLSHMGTCCISVNVDAAAITDMPALMSDLRGAFDDILGRGEPARPPRRRAARDRAAPSPRPKRG